MRFKSTRMQCEKNAQGKIKHKTLRPRVSPQRPRDGKVHLLLVNLVQEKVDINFD